MSDPAASVKIEEGWKQALMSEWGKPYFKDLKAFLLEERKQGIRVFPPGSLIFNAFNKTPYDKVKVVIIGQDPYHTPGAAHGLCFSVPRDQRIPPSLRNIYKEMQDDIGTTIPKHGNLEKWADQGILLLNSILTVRAGQAKSHHKKGWEHFTGAVLNKLNSDRQNLIFLLWGRPAQKLGELIDPSRHYKLTAAHPSPLARGAYFGSKHFSQTNAILEKLGKEPIDWQV
ncbi:MAG: uracil-DNA glycosylase [Bacteroidia bacterium]|nr:uracil-DNA glycosylase [Bacteroidia bacterium]